PWALLDYGFCALIAPSFADIFRTNCFKNGILTVTLSESEIDELFRRTEANDGYRLTVDLENQTVSDGSGLKFDFQIAPFRRECLLKGLDDIGLTLQFEDQITAYEKSHQPSATMFVPVNPASAH
ncbi:MAG: 3-isopropylmalate dehydratase small subunit, partial [Terriglobia bacterium]